MKKYLTKENYLLAFLFLATFILKICIVSIVKMPNVMADEFGYVGSAAFFSGNNWSEIMRFNSFYSYGYSILLIPVFWLANNVLDMFKAFLIINSLISSLSLFLIYIILNKLFNERNKVLLILISFACMFFPYLFNYSFFIYSESLNTVVYLILFILMIDITKPDAKWYKYIFAGILTVYSYMCHPRMLAVVLCSLFIIILLKALKKITYKNFALYFAGFIPMYCIHNIIKSILINNLWLNGANSNVNNTGSIIPRLLEFKDKAMLIAGFQTFLGHFWAQCIANCGLILLAFVTISIAIYYHFKNKENKFFKDNNTVYALIFLILSFISTWVISTIFITNSTKLNDTVIYDRYICNISIIFLAIGTYLLFQKDNFYKLSIKILLVISLVFYVFAQDALLGDSVYRYHITFSTYAAIFITKDIIKISLFFLLIGVSFLHLRKYKYITLFCLTALFGLSTLVPLKNTVDIGFKNFLKTPFTWHKGYFENLDYSLGVVNKLIENDVDIYIYRQNESFVYLNNNQFLFFKKPLKVINNLEDIDNLKNICVISSKISRPYKNMKTLKNISFYAGSYWISEDLEDKFKGYLNEDDYISLNVNSFPSQNKESESYRSNGHAGHLLFGPYIDLEKGKYKAKFELENFSDINEIGYCDIVSDNGKNVITKQKLIKSMFTSDNKCEVELEFELSEPAEKVEFRVFTNKDVILECHSIKLKFEE